MIMMTEPTVGRTGFHVLVLTVLFSATPILAADAGATLAGTLQKALAQLDMAVKEVEVS